MNTLLEIGKLDNVDSFVDKAFAAKRRFMGMGHRVYTAGDPRAAILKGMAEAACRETGQALWYDLAVKLHAKVQALKKRGIVAPCRRTDGALRQYRLGDGHSKPEHWRRRQPSGPHSTNRKMQPGAAASAPDLAA